MGCAEALAALAQLPRDQQVLLRLRAIDGLSYADIARKTGLPLGTVTSRLARTQLHRFTQCSRETFLLPH